MKLDITEPREGFILGASPSMSAIANPRDKSDTNQLEALVHQ